MDYQPICRRLCEESRRSPPHPQSIDDVACVKLREMCIKSSFLRHQGLDASMDMLGGGVVAAAASPRHWRLRTPH